MLASSKAILYHARMDNLNRPFLEACKHIGGVSAMAAALGISRSAVWQWVHAHGDRRVPVERCMQIERLTGIPCEQLRPDIEWHVLRGTESAANQGVA